MRRSYLADPARETDHGFGRPNRPSTPMGAVMSGHFEAAASMEQEWKNSNNERVFEAMSKFTGVRPHTRASAMASDHVRSNRNTMLNKQGGDMFKMTQFKAIKSRVGPAHINDRARSAAIKRHK
jgi:hypothetical protein